MNFNALMSMIANIASVEKKTKFRSSRAKYITEKYYERSISNRYFK